MPAIQSQAELDRTRMGEALALAAKAEGRTRPNPPVGAIITKDGKVIGRGYHRQAGEPHAEIIALRRAGREAQGGTLYVTLEPCSTQGRTPPCTRAILASGIRRVVVGVRDPNPVHAGRGLRILRRAGIQTNVGVCAGEAERLIAPFAKWILTGRPFLTLKLGMTLDGRIGDMTGRSRWITCPESRTFVQHLRRKADVVMVGAGTACADNPSLVSHLTGKPNGYRLIVDSSGRTPLSSTVLNDEHANRTILAVTARCAASRVRSYAQKGAQVWVLPSFRNQVSLRVLMARLGKAGFLHALCEGGGELAASLLARQLVDELLCFVAPRILGGGGIPAIGGDGWSMTSSPELEFTAEARVGDDILISARPRKEDKGRVRTRKH